MTIWHYLNVSIIISLIAIIQLYRKLYTVQLMLYKPLGMNQATGYASQHIWCLSKARINWEGCARKGIWRKNGGDGRDVDTN